MDSSIVVWVAMHRVPPLNDPIVWLALIEKLGAVCVALALPTDVLAGAGLGAAVGGLAALALRLGAPYPERRARPIARPAGNVRGAA